MRTLLTSALCALAFSAHAAEPRMLEQQTFGMFGAATFVDSDSKLACNIGLQWRDGSRLWIKRFDQQAPHIEITAPYWALHADATVPVQVSFGSRVFNLTGTTFDASGVGLPDGMVIDTVPAAWWDAFSAASRMDITFVNSREGNWSSDMDGSAAAVQYFAKCVTLADEVNAPATADPFGTAPSAPAPTPADPFNTTVLRSL